MRLLLLGSEILGPGRSEAVLGQWESTWGTVMVGARLREQAPGWCLFPVYWFPGGEQALLPEQHGAGGREAWGPGCQPAPQPGLLGLPRPPSPKPPWTNIQSFPRTGHWRSRSRCEGKGQKDGKGLPPLPPENPTGSIFLDCLCHRGLAPGSSLSLSVSSCVPGVGPGVRCPASWQTRRQEKEEGQGLECRDGPPKKTLRNQCVF